ncbi:hypothetical protein ABQE93_24325 [Mycolicibacterium sp. XJ662]
MGDVEIYCDGTQDRPHERWTVAYIGLIDDALGRRWAVDDTLSSGKQVKQYLHGDTWIPNEPVDISTEQHGPPRLRYSFVCERCKPHRRFVRHAAAIEPVLDKLAQGGVPSIHLHRFEQLCG